MDTRKLRCAVVWSAISNLKFPTSMVLIFSFLPLRLVPCLFFSRFSSFPFLGVTFRFVSFRSFPFLSASFRFFSFLFFSSPCASFFPFFFLDDASFQLGLTHTVISICAKDPQRHVIQVVVSVPSAAGGGHRGGWGFFGGWRGGESGEEGNWSPHSHTHPLTRTRIRTDTGYWTLFTPRADASAWRSLR